MMNQTLVKELFDYCDGNLIKRSTGKRVGTITSKSVNRQYVVVWAMSKLWTAHRLIFLWHHGFFPKIIDHIDQNSLNNRIENLRAVTKSENSQNSNKRKTNTSGYKGVYWRKDIEKWSSQITINCKCKNLGFFKTKEDAYEAYQIAASKLHTTNPEAKNVS
jgi:HNH endonuclease/AP2 domain